MKPLTSIHRVYCLGLGGVGVSAVGKLLLARGVRVCGSDPQTSPLIDDLIAQGVQYFPHQTPETITDDIDLVVATDDVPSDHPVRQAAERRGIPIENFSVTLARLMAETPQRLCIAGTNGKSTTTALTGLLLAGAGLDPTVVVGSRVTEFKGNVRLGQGSVFVAEADEYRDHYLNFSPTVITLTNIEPDHLDYFGTAEKMMASYATFVASLPSSGVLVANIDDRQVMKIAVQAPRVITFGFDPAANVRAVDVVQSPGRQSWTLMVNSETIGSVTLPLPGKFNMMNTLAAVAGAMASGADPKTFPKTISGFHGIWRRFQILNPGGRTTVVSDYAHHPTAVRDTLEGAQVFFPGRRIIVVFQPHHQSRLTALFDGFAHSFSAADRVIIVEAYTVPGRDIPEPQSKTSRQLADALQELNGHTTYAESPAAAVTELNRLLKPGDVAILMGAGDIWRPAEALAQHYA